MFCYIKKWVFASLWPFSVSVGKKKSRLAKKALETHSTNFDLPTRHRLLHVRVGGSEGEKKQIKKKK